MIWRALILCCGLLWASGAGAEDDGAGMLTRLLEDQLSSVGNDVRIQGFEGALSTEATIARLSISDDAGEWMVMRGLVLDWDRSALLLQQALIVQELSAEEVSLLRRPAPQPRPPQAEASPLSIPQLPVAIEIGKMRIEALTLGADYLGAPVELAISGEGRLDGQNVDAHFEARRRDGIAGGLTARMHLEAGQLDLDIALSEPEDGIAAKLLDLRDKPALDARLKGSGPLSEFVGDLGIALGGTEEIAGQLVLRQLPEGQQIGLDLAGDLRPFAAEKLAGFFGPASLLRATVTRADQATSLDALQIRSAALRLDGSGKLTRAGWPLSFALEGEIAAPDGSAVLLPLPGEARSSARSAQINLRHEAGEGPGWTGQIALEDFRSGELEMGALTLDLSGEIRAPQAPGEEGRWTVSGSYRADQLRHSDPVIERSLGSALWGELEARGASGKPSQINHATLLGAGLQARFSGQVGRSRDAYRTRLDMQLRSETLARVSELAGRPLQGAAELRGRLQYGPLTRDLTIALEGQTTDLRIGNPRLDRLLRGKGRLTLRADRDRTGTRLDRLRLTTASGTLAASADLTNAAADANFSLEMPDSSHLSPTLSGPILLTGQITRADAGKSVLTMRGDLPEAAIQIEADLAPRQERYEGRITANLSFNDLAPYRELAGLPLAGRGSARLSGTGRLAEGSFEMKLEARTQDLGFGQAQIDALFAGAAQLKGQLTRSAEGTLTLSDLAITSPAMQGDAEAELANGQLTARLDAALPDASVLDPGLRGEIRLTGRARQTQAAQTELSLSATAQDAKLDMRADLPGAGAALRYSATLDIADLASYRSLSGQDLAGPLWAQADGRFEPASGAGDIHLSGRGDDLRLGPEGDLPARLLAGQSTLRLRAARDKDGNLSLDRLRISNGALSATARGQRQAGLWSGSLDARLNDLSELIAGLTGSAEITATATGQPDGSTALRWTGTGQGAELSGQARIAPAAQNYATRFNLRGALADLRPWAALADQQISGRGEITASGDWQPSSGAGTADLRFQTQDLRMGHAILDRMLAGRGAARAQVSLSPDGRIDAAPLTASFGQLSLSAAASAANGSFAIRDLDARLADMSPLHRALSGALRLQGEVRGRAGRSDLDLALSGAGGLSAQIRGGIAPGGNPDLAISGQMPLSLINPIIAPQAVSGMANLDLALRGPGGLEALRGRITTAGSRLSIPQRNAALNNLSGHMDLTGPRAALSISATGVGGGRLSMTGSLDLANKLDADLRLGLANVLLRDPALYETRLTGALQVRGRLADGSARISGDLSLPRTEIRVPTRGIGGLSPLPEIRHINSPAPVRQTLRRAGLSLAGIALGRGGDSQTGAGARDVIAYPLDIRLDAPGRIFLRGRGIDAELGGSLRLGGTSRRIVPAGRFELIRGRLTILQQRFEFTDGYGALEGDFTPYIRLNASTDRGGVTTFVTIEGDVSSPEISFTSAPPLPEDEVLARLIFGQDLSNVSPLQAVQLASALNTLAGGSDEGILGDLRREIGLDDLDLTANEDGRAQIRAGKYLSEDIYADVAVDSQGTSSINLNLNLSPDVTVKGAASSSGESSVGIFFERDY